MDPGKDSGRDAAIEKYTWRAVVEADLPALAALDAACLAADGPASVTWATYPGLLADPGAALRCATPAGAGAPIVAAGWARIDGARAWLGGQVHPAHRRQKLGTTLLRWSETQAGTLGRPTSLAIRNEALTAGSEALYTREGFACDFIEIWMQRDLQEPLPRIPLPVAAVPWTAETAGQFFAVYSAAFAERHRLGAPRANAAEWIAGNNEDPDFRPDVSRLALAGGQPVGFLTAGVLHLPQGDQTVGWISQVGVDPAWRGRAIAAGLIAGVLEQFRSEGFAAAGLHVNANNPHAAELYARLGFRVAGRRAKYSKPRPL